MMNFLTNLVAAGRGKRDRDVQGPCFITSPELRDPFAANVFPFLRNPDSLRRTCIFFQDCYTHSSYLEAECACPYFTIVYNNNDSRGPEKGRAPGGPDSKDMIHLRSLERRAIPVLLKRLVKPTPKGGELQSIVNNGGNMILSASYRLHLVDLPSLTQIPLGSEDLTEIPKMVSEIYLQRLPNLTHILGYFGFGNGQTPTIAVLEDLPQLRSIGTNFLNNCRGLRSVRLENIPQLERIGTNMMFSCTSLTSVTFQSLPMLKDISYNAFHECSALEEIAISELPSLEALGEHFLARCTSLRRVVFEELPSLAWVRCGLLQGSSTLASISLNNLPSLKRLGSSILQDCTGLTSASFENLPQLKEVDSGWLSKCTSLESFTLVDMPLLEEVGDMWLYGCKSLKKVHFAGLPMLTRIGGGWLSRCHSLEKVRVANLPKLKSVMWTAPNPDEEDERCKYGFLYNCSNLREATFENLPEFLLGSDSWLHCCPKLISARFANLPKFKSTGRHFLLNCRNLETLSFENLPSLEFYGDDFVGYCTKLQVGQISFIGDVHPNFVKACKEELPIRREGEEEIEEGSFDLRIWNESSSDEDDF